MASKQDYIYRTGTTPQTRSLLSMKNKVYSFDDTKGAGFVQIGAMSAFNPSQSRDITEVRGVGFGDQIAELVPAISAPVSIAVTRTAMYLETLQQVFGYLANVDGLVRALKHHKWPFDIKQEIVFSDIADADAYGGQTIASSDGCHLAIVVIYEACWMASNNASFTTDSAIVNEECEIRVSDVIDGRSVYNECIDTGNKLKSGRFTGQLFSGGIRPVNLTPTGL